MKHCFNTIERICKPFEKVKKGGIRGTEEFDENERKEVEIISQFHYYKSELLGGEKILPR